MRAGLGVRVSGLGFSGLRCRVEGFGVWGFVRGAVRGYRVQELIRVLACVGVIRALRTRQNMILISFKLHDLRRADVSMDWLSLIAHHADADPAFEASTSSAGIDQWRQSRLS